MAYLANIQHTSNLLISPISDPAVVVAVVMNMIDLTVSDFESSPNEERNFQRLFPSTHAQAANACADCLSCHHKLPSFPFLVLLVILQFLSRAHRNFFNRSVASGNVRAAANDSRRCKSVISTDQWEGDSCVLFGMGRELLLIYVRDHSDMVGMHNVGIDWFGTCGSATCKHR